MLTSAVRYPIRTAPRRHTGPPSGRHGDAASEAQVVIGVAVLRHDARSMPEGRAPATRVLVRTIGVENEPAALHFSVAQLATAGAGHLVLGQRQVHVLGGVAVEVEDTQRAVALRK